MANKEALRELQSRLAERLQAARSQASSVSWLAVECSGRGFLLPLQRGGRDLRADAASSRCAHAKPGSSAWPTCAVACTASSTWRASSASIEASARARQPRERAQLVAFNPALEINCALLVDRLAGLRSADQLAAEPDTPAVAPVLRRRALS